MPLWKAFFHDAFDAQRMKAAAHGMCLVAMYNGCADDLDGGPHAGRVGTKEPQLPPL